MANGLILYVDDSETDAELFKRAAADSWHIETVIHLKDGIDALEYLVDVTKELPSATVMDHHMAGMGAAGVLQQIRGHERLLGHPVIILMDTDDLGHVDAETQSQATALIDKNTGLAGFRAVVKLIEELWDQDPREN